MLNCALIKMKRYSDEYGNLTPIESGIDVPFQIKRIYYIYGVDPQVTRGFHSHKQLHQLLLCVNGTVKIRLKNPNEEEIVTLNDPSVGLYIGPNIWREMFEFSPQSVLLVLASDHYNVSDYERNFTDYSNNAKQYFSN